MGELVRIFHATDTYTASSVVEALTERSVPMIWQVSGKRRILVPSLSLAEKVLLLLYEQVDGCGARVLARDLKQTRFDNFKRVLKNLDACGKVEFDNESQLVTISPIGEREVEARLLPTLVWD
jgi:hypothetical protein